MAIIAKKMAVPFCMITFSGTKVKLSFDPAGDGMSLSEMTRVLLSKLSLSFFRSVFHLNSYLDAKNIRNIVL